MGDDLDMFYGFGYLGWNGEWGFLNRILDCIINLVTTYQLNMSNEWLEWLCCWLDSSIAIYVFDEKFVLSNWNEIELDRNDVTRSSNLAGTG